MPRAAAIGLRGFAQAAGFMRIPAGRRPRHQHGILLSFFLDRMLFTIAGMWDPFLALRWAIWTRLVTRRALRGMLIDFTAI